MLATTDRTVKRNVGVIATAFALGHKVDLTYTDADGKTTRRRGVKVTELVPTGKAAGQVLATVKIDGESGLKRLRGDRTLRVVKSRRRSR